MYKLLGLSVFSAFLAIGAPLVTCTSNINTTNTYNTAVLGLGQTTVSGCLTSNTGAFATGEWDNSDFNIAWRVTEIAAGPDTGKFLYEYSLFTNVTGQSKGAAVSHFILEVSAACTANNPCIEDSNVAVDAVTEHSDNQGKSNEGLPGVIHGVKFDNAGVVDGNSYNYSFVSAQIPVWGNFYAKDGQGTWAYNQGLLNTNVSNYFIARVDTVRMDPVPEPSSYAALLVAMLGGLVYLRRRKAATAE